MCNLYSHTRTQDALRGLFADRTTVYRLGNLAPQEAIYPDQPAPIARLDGDDMVLQLARWGMPSPKQLHSDQVSIARSTISATPARPTGAGG